MDLLQSSPTYWAFSGQCTQCGHCRDACDSLTSADMTLGEIANGLLEAERESSTVEEVAARIAANERLVQAIRGCFFCTTCKNTCFAHNDVCDLIYHARKDLQGLGLIERDSWSTVEVDREWDIFTAYRAVYGIGYPDLTRHIANEYHDAASDCAVAFFPGCSLAAYGPELTREVFATVEELGGKATMIDHCCGSPLKSAGFFDRADDLCDRNADEIVASGAEKLVCVCPGCANAMRDALRRRGIPVEVQSLAGFLVEHGFKPKRPLPASPLYLSKSCQDRDGRYLDETLALLGLDPSAPTIFHGCCGAGGAVSSFDPNRQDVQADAKLSFAPDGACVVTMCPTCTYTYGFYLMKNPRPLPNKHYAELAFENQFDWPLVFSQLSSIWSGEYGPWLATVFDSQPTVAIIGYGTAAVNAIFALRANGYQGRIAVFSDTDTPPYSPILTSYFAGGEIAYEACFPWSDGQLAKLNVELHAGEPVVELVPSAHEIITAHGRFTYDKCLVASGASPSLAGFPQTEGYRPLVLRTLADAERLISAIEDGSCRRILISGASMVALKALEACLNRGIETSLVGINPHILDFNALPPTAERFERGLRSYGVQMRFGQSIADVEVCDGRDSSGGLAASDGAPHRLKVTFSSGEEDFFDEVLVAHGVRSNLDFIAPDALEIDRALVVDEHMRTSDPDVYAAGDVAQALELISGEKRVVGLWKNAAVQGTCAGRAMAAELSGASVAEVPPYQGSIPMNSIAVKDTLFLSAGTTMLTDSHFYRVREEDDMTVIYIFEKGADGESERLVGFNLTCDKDEPGGRAYDIGAMLTMRIEEACRR